MNWLKDKYNDNNCLNGIWMSAGSHIAAELAVKNKTQHTDLYSTDAVYDAKAYVDHQ